MHAANTLNTSLSTAEERRRVLLQELIDLAERGQDTAEALQALKQVDAEIAHLRAQRDH